MLIIYSHPNKDGHSGEILSQTLSSLDRKKQKYTILDLYEMNYDPILHQNEHYTSGNDEISEENKRIQKLIKDSDKFIFIYPTWWNNMPAVLKGFVDRIFVAGFAFRFEGKIPKKLLKGKAVVFSSTGGPRFFSKLFARDRALKLLVKDVLCFCGIKARGFSIGSSNTLNDRQLAKIKKTVKQGLGYVLK